MMAAWAPVDGWMSLGCRWSGSTRTGCGWPETSCVDCSSTRRASRSCHRSTCWSCSASTDTRPFADRCARRPPYVPINQSVTKCHQQLPRYFTWPARRAAAAAINRYLLRVRARPQQQTRRRTQLLSIDGTDRRTDGHLTV